MRLFFLIFIPGGLGGDAYVAYHLRDKYGIPFKRAIQILLSAKANGLLALILISLIFFRFSSVSNVYPYIDTMIATSSLLVLAVYHFSTKFLCGEKLTMKAKAMCFSITIQSILAVIAGVLVYGLAAEEHLFDYVALFLISNIASLPISIGGMGLREVTLYLAADYTAIDEEIGVALGLLGFTVIVGVSCLVGGIFHLTSRPIINRQQ